MVYTSTILTAIILVVRCGREPIILAVSILLLLVLYERENIRYNKKQLR